MSPAVPIEGTALGTWSPSKVASSPEGSDSVSRRFADLRGLRWRIDLGILPSLSPPSIDHLRRVTADSRRRYAGLRRRLLVDPHIPKDGLNSPSLVMDNPLSQNPDSMWGRFFRNAELERMVDQDLSRLYPEHGTYFQTPGCQSMLRRILLLWCLRHPEHGYRQGMHELLAPLLYVLHADVEHLSQVRQLYEDHFIDKFDGLTFHENDLTYNFDFKKFTGPIEDGNGSQNCPPKISNLDELDPRIQDIILLSDAYGAEGELGIVLSEKFMEHDAYCMFDALMNGTGGAVAMAEFFSPSPATGSHTGLPPAIEASSALYHLLSIVDMSLHSHLVELGVEPQYFALRWLRVLFGREFLLEDLLLIWDEIFANDNRKLPKFADDTASSVGVLNSHRGAFISAFAVSMILYIRSSLLATENATSCLQRLLNFPADINLDKLIVKAKTLKVVSLDANNSMLLPTHYGAFDQSKPLLGRGQSLSSGSVSPRTPLSLVPESYWEEKWRDLHKAEELKQSSPQKVVPNRKNGWSEKVRLSLSRTGSAPSPSKVYRRESERKVSVRRNLLEDLSRQLGLEEDSDKVGGGSEDLGLKEPTSEKLEVHVQDGTDKNSCPAEERCLSGNAASEENSSIISDSQSANDHEHQSERSSAASNASLDENDDYSYNVDPSRAHGEDSSLIVSDSAEDGASKSESITDCAGKTMAAMDFPADKSLKSGKDEETVGKPVTVIKERKILSGKFHWLWNFGRRGGEWTPERVPSDATKAPSGEYDQNGTATSLSVNESSNSSLSGEQDQSSNPSLRNLGHSMLENIQVIESVIQQERGQVGALENFSRNILAGKGQVTAMSALKELRKISNLLSEM